MSVPTVLRGPASRCKLNWYYHFNLQLEAAPQSTVTAGLWVSVQGGHDYSDTGHSKLTRSPPIHAGVIVLSLIHI